MVQSVAASIGQTVGNTLWETGKFTVTNSYARNTAMLALSFFVGPCALAVTSGYLTMKALGNPDVFSWIGVTDPKTKLIAKIGVSVLCAAATFEVVSASATLAKVAALTGFAFFAAPEIVEMISGAEESPKKGILDEGKAIEA